MAGGVWDRTRLRLPMKIGDVVLKITMARFSRTLATLVGAGVDIVKSLEITGATSGNWWSRRLSGKSGSACRKGSIATRWSRILFFRRWSVR